MDSATLHRLRLVNGFYAVPCGTCTLCCHGDAIRILPHEDATRWQTQPHDRVPGALMLAHKANGDCVYLGDAGCTRQADKPQVCCEMDCRRVATNISKQEAERLDKKGAMPIAIWKRGKELLKEWKR